MPAIEAIPTLPSADAVRGMHDLTGRVALVTGGGSGLGRAMAWGLACHGAEIIIVDREKSSAAATASSIADGSGRRAISLVADVSQETQVDRVCRDAVEAFGRVDVLINNAGHNVRKPIVEYSTDEFDSLHAVHVRGTFLFCRALAPHMILAQVGAPNVGAYAAAKAAVAQLSRVFALEMAPHGVRVNALAPGYIDTPLTRQHAPATREKICNTTPLGRFGEPHELIGPVVFLASDASTFVTGTVLTIDGGWTAQ